MVCLRGDENHKEGRRTSMCTGGKDGKKGDDGCIVWELYKGILIGKV
jgi:hypothetical protein